MADRKTMRKVDELSPDQLLTIIQKNDDGSFARRVRAPLPDGYGMSVGSAFTDPNNMDLASQVSGGGKVVQAAVGVITGAARLSGFSTKITQRSNVFYSGPEPTEISFEINFNSFYSAYDEVVVPAATLMMMAVGREMPFEQLNETVGEALRAIQSATTGEHENTGFGFIRSAGVCSIRFGRTLSIPRGYISSVAPKFSNVLDNQGYPISASCSVTVKVVRNPTQYEVGSEYFHGAVR